MEKGKNVILQAARRPIRVRSIHDAGRLLSRVLMQLQKDEISEAKAKSIGYVCNSYIKAFEMSDLESRLVELEKRVQCQDAT